jgi:hypothetical protein
MLNRLRREARAKAVQRRGELPDECAMQGFESCDFLRVKQNAVAHG